MYDIETLIPHRGHMRLVDEILEFGDDGCVTAAVVKPYWPLCEEGRVSQIVLIELVAQSVGMHFALEDKPKSVSSEERPGWLVGVKKAVFSGEGPTVGERIIVSTSTMKRELTYVEVRGIARIGSAIAGEVLLQVFRPEE
ncbi:MAG: hypothetical protein E4G96_08170 [Chrysiogenales bacterium]|nr:MAG: hypothetical protein E4G96_08170 [Chrysiogenales bacterium]